MQIVGISNPALLSPGLLQSSWVICINTFCSRKQDNKKGKVQWANLQFVQLLWHHAVSPIVYRFWAYKCPYNQQIVIYMYSKWPKYTQMIKKSNKL